MAMSHKQHLLGKLAEESAEIAQIALKASQFGLEETKPEQDLTNAERIYQEINDLVAIIRMLNERCPGFRYVMCDQSIEDKIEKVDRYLGYSENLGMVDGDNPQACAACGNIDEPNDHRLCVQCHEPWPEDEREPHIRMGIQVAGND